VHDDNHIDPIDILIAETEDILPFVDDDFL